MGQVLACALELIAPKHEIRSVYFLAQQCLALIGTTGNTSGTLSLSADHLILGTQTTETDISHTRHGGDWAWQEAEGEGSSDQTTNYNQLNVGALLRPVNGVQIGLGA